MRGTSNAGSAVGAGPPAARGLYSPRYEHDSCGVGFVCDIKGRASRAILDDANRINCRMGHRGGIGCEPGTGDGAGILTGLPHRLLRRVAREQLGIALPPPGQYGVGIAFLPRDRRERQICKESTEAIIVEQGQRLLGWRRLPHSAERAGLTPTALGSMPHLEQLFVGAGDGYADSAFERQLYIIRKYASHCLRGDPRLSGRELPYFCSLSSNTVIYKGMLTPHQLFEFFDDLRAGDYESHMAMVHSRFSTNTFPSWDRAQPNRAMCHNGEINTLLGNCNWMNAREGVLRSELFGDDLEKLFPIIEPNCSDSGNFDNVLEFLLMTGRSLPESVMTMIPEAWQQRPGMPADKRAFYEFQSCLMEPWDGPALIPFTDGHCIGAVLDRNGLRPSRYYVTDDNRCVMASEVGVLPVAPERVVKKGRLHPGRLFLIDFDAGTAGAGPRAQVGVGEAAALRRVAGATAPGAGGGRRSARLRRDDRPPSHAGLRLYRRDRAIHASQPGARPARPARIDGQRCGAGGARRPAAHALRLLQAALRAGDEPRHRLDPRGSGHVARVLHRARGQPARGHRGARAPAAPSPSDPLQPAVRRALETRAARMAEPDPRHHLRARLREAWSARRPPASRRKPTGRWRRATGCSCSRTARSARTAWPSAPCSPWAACITTWCARISAPASPSSSRPARRAKCTITVFCSAMVRTPSIPISPTNASGTSGAPGGWTTSTTSLPTTTWSPHTARGSARASSR